MTEHARFHDAEGIAALGICESLLLALTDLKIISEKDARDLLTDVATTHHEAATASQTPQKHQAVVEIVQRSSLARTGCGVRSGSRSRLRRLRKTMPDLKRYGDIIALAHICGRYGFRRARLSAQ
jgi:hypothetical protein